MQAISSSLLYPGASCNAAGLLLLMNIGLLRRMLHWRGGSNRYRCKSNVPNNSYFQDLISIRKIHCTRQTNHEIVTNRSEPTIQDTISILRGIKEKYEVHHGVRITDGALVAAATYSNRYITDRFLPDKAIDLMDEAASGLRLQQESKPEASF